jgi:hypothetical protein
MIHSNPNSMPASALGMQSIEDGKPWPENDSLSSINSRVKGNFDGGYKVKIDNAHNNTISILSNNFVMPASQQQ